MKVKALFENFDKIEKEKGIAKDKLVEMVSLALKKTYLKENPDVNIDIKIDVEKETIRLYEKKLIVPDDKKDIDDDKEIYYSDAIKLKKNYKVNSVALIQIDIEKFERRLANYFGQLLNHSINDYVNNQVYLDWKDKKGMIIRAEVDKIDNNIILVNLGSTKGVVTQDQKIINEKLQPGHSYMFLIKDVRQVTKLWPVILSRNDNELFKYILKNEVSEIANGLIEITHLVRIPGIKAKIALKSNQPGIDPISIVIGYKAERIKKISSLLNGEKIDVFLYDDDPKQFLVNAVYPNHIYGLEISDDEDKPKSKIVTIVVKDDEEYGKIVGKKGKNLKLLSQLTNWSIDVVPLALAKEDQIKFEDVSHLVSSKMKYNPNKSNNNSNWKNNSFNFQNLENFQYKNETNYDQYNLEYEQKLAKITDEDIEKFLNTEDIPYAKTPDIKELAETASDAIIALTKEKPNVNLQTDELVNDSENNDVVLADKPTVEDVAISEPVLFDEQEKESHKKVHESLTKSKHDKKSEKHKNNKHHKKQKHNTNENDGSSVFDQIMNAFDDDFDFEHKKNK